MESSLAINPKIRLAITYLSMILQVVIFITSIITSVVAAKTLKFNIDSYRSCFLYMTGQLINPKDPTDKLDWTPTSSSSVSCSAIQTISGINALGSALIFITLVWLTYFGLKKSNVVFGIMISLAVLCAFIALVASCMYSVGLNYTRDNANGYFDVIIRATAIDSKAIESGRLSTWIACLSWMTYALLEFMVYRYYEKNLL